MIMMLYAYNLSGYRRRYGKAVDLGNDLNKHFNCPLNLILFALFVAINVAVSTLRSSQTYFFNAGRSHDTL